MHFAALAGMVVESVAGVRFRLLWVVVEKGRRRRLRIVGIMDEVEAIRRLRRMRRVRFFG